jgi:hypothetical protein
MSSPRLAACRGRSASAPTSAMAFGKARPSEPTGIAGLFPLRLDIVGNTLGLRRRIACGIGTEVLPELAVQRSGRTA